MSKGPKIKDWVKWYIGTEALKNRAEPRDSVAERIEACLEDKEPVPSRDTINKIISGARNSNDPEDRPWSMATLDEYPIPPQAIPAVLAVWKFRLEQWEEFITREVKHPYVPHEGFTIREAKWAARLSSIEADTEVLSSKAAIYAHMELAYKLIGRSFDSGGLDRMIMDLPLGEYENVRLLLKKESK